MRSTIAQALARPVIEQVHRLIDLSLCHLEQTALFREELAQESIGVLIESTLPGAVRARKVHIRFQTARNELVLGELLAS